MVHYTQKNAFRYVFFLKNKKKLWKLEKLRLPVGENSVILKAGGF